MTTKPHTGDALHNSLRDLLTNRLQLPAQPVDGDCLIWPPKVVEVMRALNYAASETRVTGWLDRSNKLLGFLHHAVLLDTDIVVDVTARQFSTQLPPIWVAPIPDYCAELAMVTGVTHVTVEPIARPPAERPPRSVE